MSTTPATRAWIRKKKRRRRRWVVPVWILAVVLVGAALNVWLALRREAVETRVRGILRDTLACPFELESIELGWTSGAEVRAFRIIDPESGGTIARVERLRIVPRIAKLLTGEFDPRLVVLEDVEVNVARRRDGRWNFADVLRPLPEDDAEMPLELPGVVVRGCRLRYADESTRVLEGVEDVELTLSADGDGAFAFSCRLRQEYASSLEVSGRCMLDAVNPAVDLRVRAWKLDLASPLLRLLPPAHFEPLAEWELGGSVDIDGQMRIDAADGVRIQRVGGQFIRCEVSPPGLALPIRNVTGKFLVRERTIEVTEVQGDVGGGTLAGHCALEIDWRDGRLIGWRGHLDLDGVPVSTALIRSIDTAAAKEIEAFEFDGRVGGSVEITDAREFPPPLEDIEASLRLQGLDLIHPALPAPIAGIRGEVRLRRGLLAVSRPLVAECLGAGVRIPEGRFDLGDEGVIDITLKLGGGATNERAQPRLVLDDRCRQALPDADYVELWDDFQLRGEASATARLERDARTASDAAGSPIRFSMAVFLHDVRMAHKSFPYEVRGITGTVEYDSETDLVTIKDLRGTHGDEVVVGSGGVDVARDGIFSVTLRCDDLACSPDLLAALGDEGRALVQDFGFQGRVKTEVVIHSVDDDVDVVTEVDVIEASIRPARFPYPLELAGGKLVLVGERLIELRDIRTPAGAEPSVVFDGSITVKDHVRRIEYDFGVERLAVDQVLLDALPLGLDEFFLKFGLKGTYRGKLAGWYVMDAEHPENNRLFYEGTDVTSDDAVVDFGIKIKDIHATGRFVGGHTAERPSHFWGSVAVESAWFNRLHLTDGDVLFHFGEPHAYVKADRAGQEVPGRKYAIPPEFLSRLNERDVRDTFQMSVHSNDVYGGQVDGFLYADTGSIGDVAGDFVARGLQLSQAAKDIFGVDGRQVTGEAEGNVRFRGLIGDIKTVRGNGVGVIRKAQLVELPLFLRVLNILKLDFQQAGARNYFSDVVLPYTIGDGVFRASRLEIKSPAMTLVGDGTLDFRGNLDLVLKPQVVDASIPLWDQLVSLLKDALARVRVRGDLADPKVDFVTGFGVIKIPVETDREDGVKRPLPRRDDE